MKQPTWKMIKSLKKENRELFTLAGRMIEQYKADVTKFKHEADEYKWKSDRWQKLYIEEVEVNKRMSSIMSDMTNKIIKQYS